MAEGEDVLPCGFDDCKFLSLQEEALSVSPNKEANCFIGLSLSSRAKDWGMNRNRKRRRADNGLLKMEGSSACNGVEWF